MSRLFFGKQLKDYPITRYGSSSWEIKFKPNDKNCSSCHVLFKGASHNERDLDYGKVFNFPPGVETAGVEKNIEEIVFERRTGNSQIYVK